MRQILLPSHESHILPTILMLATALERESVHLSRSPLYSRSWRAVVKMLDLFGVRRLGFSGKKTPVFFHLNHPARNSFYPFCLTSPLVTYSFDVWPYVWDDWQRLFEINAPAISFISAKVPMAEMQRRVPGVDFRWLPEAVNPDRFESTLPLSDRAIDVLEVGRPFSAYHNCVREPLRLAGYRHEYPVSAASAVIPYKEVVKRYGQSKIVVCFPRSVTHPDQAKNVETTTFRYFECMASKAVMIGHCPQELIDILGYNPVIEANMERPGKQLVEEILLRVSEYQSLVDRNYETLCQTWTVNHQAVKIRAAMEEVLARPPYRHALIS